MSDEEKMDESEEASLEPLMYKVKSKIAYITINTKMNTISIENAQKLTDLLKSAENDKKVMCVILKSTEDKVFSAGFDLNIFKQGLSEKVTDDVLNIGGMVSRTIFFMSKPVIAQIQGSAIGLGCIMALSCDFRFVAQRDDLFFQLPEIDIKIFPATGPTTMAIHVLGMAHAKDMLLTGRRVSLQEFDKWGGVTQIVPPEDLAKTVKKFARGLTEKTTELLHLIKPAINMITYEKAKEWYSLEDEFCRYYFDGFFGKDRPDFQTFVEKMWNKYGKGKF